jgi:VWFA-related protein
MLSLVPAALLVLCFTAGRLAADPRRTAQEQVTPQFRAATELVVLRVMVKDRKGEPVPGLSASAFTVLEDGRPQHIEFFGQEDAPVTVGLVVDNSGSMLPVRDRVIAAAGAFVDTSHPRDEIFALAFNERVRAALPPQTPFTGESAVLRTGLSETLIPSGRTALYDAVSEGVRYLATGTHVSKVLVVVSDGGDNASSATFDAVLNRALATNIVVYVVWLADPLEPDASPGPLKKLAEMTGGDWFQPRGTADVEQALRQVARDIRHSYTLGYAPMGTSRDGRLQRVRVSATAPNRERLRVRTRQGYVIESDR